FTRVSPTTAEHVAKGLAGRIDLLLDGGPTRVGIESTVLDVSGERPVLLRPGSLPLSALEAAAGPIALPERIEGEAARPSPGMLDRHYSPRGELRVIPVEDRGKLGSIAAEAAARGRRVGALLLRDGPGHPGPTIRLPADPDG